MGLMILGEGCWGHPQGTTRIPQRNITEEESRKLCNHWWGETEKHVYKWTPTARPQRIKGQPSLWQR